MALNAPIQGSAADVIKKAMIELDPQLGAFDAQMLLQIHDELVIEVPVEHLDSVAAVTSDVMEGVVQLQGSAQGRRRLGPDTRRLQGLTSCLLGAIGCSIPDGFEPRAFARASR